VDHRDRADQVADYDAYWVPRGWAQQAPIKTESRIDTPRDGSKRKAGTVVVAGVAWAQHAASPRSRCRSTAARGGGDAGGDGVSDTWREWSYAWQATAGSHDVRVRATDLTGQTQTSTPAAPAPGRRRRMARHQDGPLVRLQLIDPTRMACPSGGAVGAGAAGVLSASGRSGRWPAPARRGSPPSPARHSSTRARCRWTPSPPASPPPTGRPSTCTSTWRCRGFAAAHATPATTTVPALRLDPSRGVSIRDSVLIGACCATHAAPSRRRSRRTWSARSR